MNPPSPPSSNDAIVAAVYAVMSYLDTLHDTPDAARAAEARLILKHGLDNYVSAPTAERRAGRLANLQYGLGPKGIFDWVWPARIEAELRTLADRFDTACRDASHLKPVD